MFDLNNNLDPLYNSINDQMTADAIEKLYQDLKKQFESAYEALPQKFMARAELTFHDHIKLVAHSCLAVSSREGAVVEIGVWKGFSLALLSRIVTPSTTIIGIDPCILEGQYQELNYFQNALFPNAKIIPDYSFRCVNQVSEAARNIKILHIDGGHLEWNVWADFLLYDKLMIAGGYIIFDDYNDHEFSPEVKTAVDKLAMAGYFKDYDLLGVIEPFNNYFVIRRKAD